MPYFGWRKCGSVYRGKSSVHLQWGIECELFEYCFFLSCLCMIIIPMERCWIPNASYSFRTTNVFGGDVIWLIWFLLPLWGSVDGWACSHWVSRCICQQLSRLFDCRMRCRVVSWYVTCERWLTVRSSLCRLDLDVKLSNNEVKVVRLP